MRSCPCVDDGPCSVELFLAHPFLEKGLQVQTRGWRRRASRPRWAIPYLLEGLLCRLQAGLSILCLFLCLCSGRRGLPTRFVGCALSCLPCWPAACSVVSTSCGHKPHSECLLRTRPGAARSSCAHRHRRPTCGCGSWLGPGVESHYQERQQQTGGRTQPVGKQGVVATAKPVAAMATCQKAGVALFECSWHTVRT